MTSISKSATTATTASSIPTKEQEVAELAEAINSHADALYESWTKGAPSKGDPIVMKRMNETLELLADPGVNSQLENLVSNFVRRDRALKKFKFVEHNLNASGDRASSDIVVDGDQNNQKTGQADSLGQVKNNRNNGMNKSLEVASDNGNGGTNQQRNKASLPKSILAVVQRFEQPHQAKSNKQQPTTTDSLRNNNSAYANSSEPQSYARHSRRQHSQEKSKAVFLNDGADDAVVGGDSGNASNNNDVGFGFGVSIRGPSPGLEMGSGGISTTSCYQDPSSVGHDLHCGSSAGAESQTEDKPAVPGTTLPVSRNLLWAEVEATGRSSVTEKKPSGCAIRNVCSPTKSSTMTSFAASDRGLSPTQSRVRHIPIQVEHEDEYAEEQCRQPQTKNPRCIRQSTPTPSSFLRPNRAETSCHDNNNQFSPSAVSPPNSQLYSTSYPAGNIINSGANSSRIAFAKERIRQSQEHPLTQQRLELQKRLPSPSGSLAAALALKEGKRRFNSSGENSIDIAHPDINHTGEIHPHNSLPIDRLLPWNSSGATVTTPNQRGSAVSGVLPNSFNTQIGSANNNSSVVADRVMLFEKFPFLNGHQHGYNAHMNHVNNIGPNGAATVGLDDQQRHNNSLLQHHHFESEQQNKKSFGKSNLEILSRDIGEDCGDKLSILDMKLDPSINNSNALSERTRRLSSNKKHKDETDATIDLNTGLSASPKTTDSASIPKSVILSNENTSSFYNDFKRNSERSAVDGRSFTQKHRLGANSNEKIGLASKSKFSNIHHVPRFYWPVALKTDEKEAVFDSRGNEKTSNSFTTGSLLPPPTLSQIQDTMGRAETMMGRLVQSQSNSGIGTGTIDFEQLGLLFEYLGIPLYWKKPFWMAIINFQNHAANGGTGSDEDFYPEKTSAPSFLNFYRMLISNCPDESAKFMRVINWSCKRVHNSNSSSTNNKSEESTYGSGKHSKGFISSRWGVGAPFVPNSGKVKPTHSQESFGMNDLIPLIQDVVDTHPGLGFLRDAPEFHTRYVTTVISRIFYKVNRSWSGRITLPELRRANLLQVLRKLQLETDVNVITEYFSYEHFYVIYCKFWELDKDHDLLIDKSDLAQHQDHALSSRLIDRIFAGGTVLRGWDCNLANINNNNNNNSKSTPPSVNGKMTYSDFVWFILSEEDKKTPTAIEYWFRCLDLDGDGILSPYELEYFYSEQESRIECLGIEPLEFGNIFCQLVDMLRCRQEGIRLSDLKNNPQLSAHVFNTLFNLDKYLEHEQRDPFASSQIHLQQQLMNQQCPRHDQHLQWCGYSEGEQSDWDRFAAMEYELLIAEETASSCGSSSAITSANMSANPSPSSSFNASGNSSS